ncbi:putative uncharacterized protein DDB_G0282499 [Drosophila grimshawi]|uniref:GH24647 n=1 Tax=Drosophila grimshawi TaxID=7222 RepID=B4JML3_DROGR|nr:putative uncharacterized protein DDB_G0282499 [Drosophila grimshawi]EDV91956.1 GH24647 [Drosophila grimshawi]
MNSLGNNRYQMLFIDDEPDDFEAGQRNLDGGQQKTKQQLKNNKKLFTGSDKTKGIVVNNKNKKLVANIMKTMPGPVQQQQQEQLQCHQCMSYMNNNNNNNISNNNRKYVHPTRNVTESKAYGAATGGSNNSNNNNNRRLEKSEFDRHSGSDKTGVKAVAKQNGAKVKQHMGTTPYNDTATANANNEDEDVKYITIKEYEAMRSERLKPVFNIRKAGEGEMERPDWKQMTVLQKKKTNAINSETNALGYDASMYPQRWRRQQRVDIELKFNYNAHYKGQYRRRPSIGQVEAGHGEQQPVDLQDKSEFPTLCRC